MGLFATFSFLGAANQPLAQRIGAAVFASVFAIIGAGLVFGSLYGYSVQKKQSEVELANPSSPWLWRTDWAASRVESKNKKTAIGWWVTAILVNMLSLPVSLFAISQGLATDPKLIVPAAFEAVGLIVLCAAVRATIRFERFGRTYFEMTSLPFSPGSRVADAQLVLHGFRGNHRRKSSGGCRRLAELVQGQGRRQARSIYGSRLVAGSRRQLTRTGVVVCDRTTKPPPSQA
jgi:hypothetical protein